MKFAVTGSDGFLGWHTRCALKARGDTLVAIDRSLMQDANGLARAVRDVDAVLHLAGVNRAEPGSLREENLTLASNLTEALHQSGARPRIVYANSIQSGNGTAFGDGKQAAAEHLMEWGHASDVAVADVHLPNLFGEHGRPHYNSVVATFCHELSRGGQPVIEQDRELPLLHAQDAVDYLLDVAEKAEFGTQLPPGRPVSVSATLELLTTFRDLYSTGDIPDLTDPLHLALFNTYRSFCFPTLYPIRPPMRADDRGHLFECVRGHGGQAQVFCSTSHPGVTRGQHFHRRKVERFLVLAGTAEITLRRMFDNRIVRFEVCGDESGIVDMPTLWVHAITNTGSNDLMTLFWSNEVFDSQQPDTYAATVEMDAKGSQ